MNKYEDKNIESQLMKHSYDLIIFPKYLSLLSPHISINIKEKMNDCDIYGIYITQDNNLNYKFARFLADKNGIATNSKEIYQAIQVALDSHEEFNHLFADIPFDSQEALLEAYPELSYTFKVIDSVVTNKEAIDQKISQLSTGWSIDRIVRMDLVLLRMAIAEMEYLEDEDVPKAVALNEALEISKVYSDEKSSKFINGVLSNLV